MEDQPKSKRSRGLTQDQIDRIMQLKDSHTIRQIADAIGVTSMSMVQRVIKGDYIARKYVDSQENPKPNDKFFDWKDFENHVY